MYDRILLATFSEREQILLIFELVDVDDTGLNWTLVDASRTVGPNWARKLLSFETVEGAAE
jgi:hypothetical protein